MKKKILIGSILTLIIGTQAFGRGRWHGGEQRSKFYGSNPAITCGIVANNTFQDGGKNNFNGMEYGLRGRFRKSHMINNSEFEKLSITMDEKRLEIRKEMIKDTPDWNKIEKLNIDMSTEMAKFKTQIMKSKYEEMKKFQAEMDKSKSEVPVTSSSEQTLPPKTN